MCESERAANKAHQEMVSRLMKDNDYLQENLKATQKALECARAKIKRLEESLPVFCRTQAD